MQTKDFRSRPLAKQNWITREKCNTNKIKLKKTSEIFCISTQCVEVDLGACLKQHFVWRTNRTLKVTRERALNEKINKSLSERVGQHIDERKRAKQAHLLTSWPIFNVVHTFHDESLVSWETFLVV